MSHNVLITGGAGFIGSHLADALLARGHDVVLLDNLHPQVHGPDQRVPGYLNPGARLVRGDVRDAGLVRRLLEDADVIFHLAAYTGVGQSMYRIREYLDVNVQGTAVLLEALVRKPQRVHSLVVASSRAVYGEGSYRCPQCGPVSPATRAAEQLQAGRWEVACPACGRQVSPLPTAETQPPDPGSIYALSKLNQEQACLIVGQAYDLPVVALRYFNVYGPRQSLRNPYTGVITTFMTRLAHGQAPEVYEDGAESRDFVHIDDVTQANLLAMDSDAAAGQVFNVGSGRQLSLLQVAQVVSAAYGGPEPVISGKYRAGDIRHCHADLARSRQVLDYEPQIDFETGIRDLVEHLRGRLWEDLTGQAEAELRARGLAAQVAGAAVP